MSDIKHWASDIHVNGSDYDYVYVCVYVVVVGPLKANCSIPLSNFKGTHSWNMRGPRRRNFQIFSFDSFQGKGGKGVTRGSSASPLISRHLGTPRQFELMRISDSY